MKLTAQSLMVTAPEFALELLATGQAIVLWWERVRALALDEQQSLLFLQVSNQLA